MTCSLLPGVNLFPSLFFSHLKGVYLKVIEGMFLLSLILIARWKTVGVERYALHDMTCVVSL